jgi:urease subunit gamma/beta
MRLTAWEEQRLLIFSAAELARRHRGAGIRLNHPEAVAIICDAMLEAARAGASFEAVEAAGRTAVRAEELLPGVAALVDEVRLEVLLEDGTRLIVLTNPIASGTAAEALDGPGAIDPAGSPPVQPVGRERRRLLVRNTSGRPVRVSSHYPFERVNARLEFDRDAAAGFRLDLPAGSSIRWGPGEAVEVELIRYGGETG